MADLRSLRATCKAMCAAATERSVGRRVALEKEEAMRWLEHERYLAVVDHLADAGNPEACFIVGLTIVFVRQDTQPGLRCLHRAAAAGHKAAAYVLGLLLYVAGGDQDRDAGRQYIRQVEGDGERTTNRESLRCRELAAEAVRQVTWKVNGRPGRVLELPEDGHRCTGRGCGATEDWGECGVFCSDGCRIRHEFSQFFTRVLNYLP